MSECGVPLFAEADRRVILVRAVPDVGGAGLIRRVGLVVALDPEDVESAEETFLAPLDARNLADALSRAADELTREGR
ncbi:MAG: hypothetical protein JW895_16675 [Thermoleophilaceae bacterium]|nr:hypothetical protein [Thermoleophilaceae bacterium]